MIGAPPPAGDVKLAWRPATVELLELADEVLLEGKFKNVRQAPVFRHRPSSVSLIVRR